MNKSSRKESGSDVYIRLPQIEDCEEFIRLNRESRHLYKSLVSPVLTKRSFEDYIKRCSHNDFKGFFICRKEDKAIVGSINLSQIFWGGFKSAYMGYRVGSLYSGKGYMTEGMKLVISHAFSEMKLHRLEANIQPENRSSIALVKRVGFTREGFSRRYLKIGGRWRDHERWAILKEDWVKKKQSRQS